MSLLQECGGVKLLKEHALVGLPLKSSRSRVMECSKCIEVALFRWIAQNFCHGLVYLY